MKPFHSWLQECAALWVQHYTHSYSNRIRVTDGSSVRFYFYIQLLNFRVIYFLCFSHWTRLLLRIYKN